MRVLVSLEHRFQRTPDGCVWTATSHPYTFWTRYLDVFDEVDVLARVLDVKNPDPRWIRANGPGVNFISVPHFLGPNEYARWIFGIRRSIAEAGDTSEAVIMRVPSLVGQTLAGNLRRSRHPFGLEVVGDPFDVFAPEAGIRHPLRPVFRKWFSAHLRRQCREARAVAYVTEHALQRRYPSSALTLGISDVLLPQAAFSTSYSSVELTLDPLLSIERERKPQANRAVLAFVGTFEQMYKAPDVLIKAVGQAIAKGCDLTLELAGDGQYKRNLQELAESLGIGSRCTFLGQLSSGAAVHELLDRSDLFVLPSRVEGLPRAMVEAMARGLPCIGSQVGGIPELLEPRYLVPPGDVDALTAKILEMVADPESLRKASERNLREAHKYRDETLRIKRIQFFRHVRAFTADWIEKRNARAGRSRPHQGEVAI